MSSAEQLKEHINSLSDQRTRSTSGVSGSIDTRISLIQEWEEREQGGKKGGRREVDKFFASSVNIPSSQLLEAIRGTDKAL